MKTKRYTRTSKICSAFGHAWILPKPITGGKFQIDNCSVCGKQKLRTGFIPRGPLTNIAVSSKR